MPNRCVLKNVWRGVFCVGVVLAGCRTGQRIQPEPEINLVADVNYQAIIPQDASRYHLAAGETVLIPEPDEIVAPEFPATMMHQDMTAHILTRLEIDTEGKVARITFDKIT